MTDQRFQQAVLDQLAQLQQGQQRLEGRMDRLEEQYGGLDERMERGFVDVQSLLSEVFGSPIAEGVELYTDRQIRAHEERFHPDAQVTS